jgi:hypothetical protein
MKYQLFIILICFSFQDIFPQENVKLKRFKCFDNMPKTMDCIANMDTIFVLFQKSNDKKLVQIKYEDRPDEYKRYKFINHLFFPMQVYYYSNLEKVKVQPAIMYKTKSYICKNMYRTVDVNFLYRYEMHFGLTFFEKTIFLIVELDSKVKGKYKIIQVDKPDYIQE